MSKSTLKALADAAGGSLQGDPERLVDRVSTVEEADPDSLAFVSHRRYVQQAAASRAGAFLAAKAVATLLPEERNRIVVDDPYVALRQVLLTLHPPLSPCPGVHPSAVIDPSASVDPSAEIGANAVIGSKAVIGAEVVVGAQAVVGDGVRIGAGSRIHSQVTLFSGVQIGERCEIHSGARIGSEGYGYTYVNGGHRKVPQVGGCRIGNDVDIGANSTIDRGSIGDTVVGDGTKIDNLVHIGHNVRIGRHVLIIAQVGVSGSTRIGDGAVLGGQAGVAGHITIGPGARVGAQAGVTASVDPGETVSGYPARPHREALRAQAALFRLPELMRRLRGGIDAGSTETHTLPRDDT